MSVRQSDDAKDIFCILKNLIGSDPQLVGGISLSTFIAVFAVVLHFEDKVVIIRPLFKESQSPMWVPITFFVRVPVKSQSPSREPYSFDNSYKQSKAS